jgi:hygromycin-B 7''-O-kinase
MGKRGPELDSDMLPQVSSIEQYRALNLRDPVFATAAASILESLRLPTDEITFPEDGSSPVAMVGGQRVIKFFAPPFIDGFCTEKSALRFLGPLGSLAPTFEGEGIIDGWNYVIMRRLSGYSLKKLWPSLTKQEKGEACFQVGQALRAIHELPIGAAGLEIVNWTEFLDAQSAACVQRQEKLGLRPDLTCQIWPFLQSVRLQPSGPPSFLHTEVMRDHVFFDRRGGRLEFSGFIDFEPSMVGEREYDFPAVGVFLSSGDPQALNAFFEGYGNLQALDEEFRRRILVYGLLHKYSNFKWYLEFMPDADSLEQLAARWWATSEPRST